MLLLSVFNAEINCVCSCGCVSALFQLDLAVDIETCLESSHLDINHFCKDVDLSTWHHLLWKISKSFNFLQPPDSMSLTLKPVVQIPSMTHLSFVVTVKIICFVLASVNGPQTGNSDFIGEFYRPIPISLDLCLLLLPINFLHLNPLGQDKLSPCRIRDMMQTGRVVVGSLLSMITLMPVKTGPDSKCNCQNFTYFYAIDYRE